LTANEFDSLINNEWLTHADYADMTRENTPMRAFLVIICKKAKIEVEDLDCINDIEKQFGLVKNIDAVRNLTADAITSYPFDIAVTNELQKFISYGTFRSLLASCSDHLHSLTSLISPSHLGINISLPMSRKCPQC